MSDTPASHPGEFPPIVDTQAPTSVSTTIHKQRLAPDARNLISGIPRFIGLDPKMSDVIPCVWFTPTDPAEFMAHVVFIGTGHPLEGEWEYLGTTVCPNGLVWHGFWRETK